MERYSFEACFCHVPESRHTVRQHTVKPHTDAWRSVSFEGKTGAEKVEVLASAFGQTSGRKSDKCSHMKRPVHQQSGQFRCQLTKTSLNLHWSKGVSIWRRRVPGTRPSQTASSVWTEHLWKTKEITNTRKTFGSWMVKLSKSRVSVFICRPSLRTKQLQRWEARRQQHLETYKFVWIWCLQKKPSQNKTWSESKQAEDEVLMRTRRSLRWNSESFRTHRRQWVAAGSHLSGSRVSQIPQTQIVGPPLRWEKIERN